MLVLFTDTDTDITKEEAEYFGYHLISMPYSYDGKTVYPYEDFEVFDSKGFYNMLREGVLPTTSAISAERYKDYFEPFMKRGDDILYVHFSAAMTATFECMNQALEELKAKYPESHFYSIDTKGITLGSLGIVKEIGDMYRANKGVDEIIEWSKTEVDKFAVYFYADDLKFFHKSGRVSGLAATMGNLLGVRPIIYMNSEGKMVNIGKERGRIRALERLVSYVCELGDNVKEHRIIIGHSDALESAEQLEAMLRERLGDGLRIEYAVVNPTAGSHCGPDSIGVSFHAVHR